MIVARRARGRFGVGLLLLGVLFQLSVAPGGTAYGQQEKRDQLGRVDPLAAKEGMIHDRFQRFEDRVYRLREMLADNEPENASRLVRVMRRAGELGLEERLQEMIKLLGDPSTAGQALDFHADWLADAGRLLDILLERDGENEERKREIERLQEYKERIDKLLEQEKDLRSDTGAAGQGGELGQQLDQALQKVEALQRRQSALSEQGGASTSGDPSAAESTQKDQEELARETKELAKQVEELSKQAEQEGERSEQGKSASAEQIDKAASALKDGSKSMSKAGEQMGGGDNQSASQSQEKAEEALEEAKDRLKEAKEKLADSDDASKLAQRQEEAAKEAAELSEKMQQDAQDGSGSSQQGKSGSGSSTPGQQNLDQAKQEMDQAKSALDESKPDEATPSQDRAIDQLEKAKEELEEALSQLRQEEREETLRDLEARFREMHAKQRGINDETLTVAEVVGQRSSLPSQPSRAEQLKLSDLSSRQRVLSEDAATCLHILDEDGTTIVFPRVMEQLSEDMGTVSERLALFHSGVLTQAIQQEILDTLEQLLESVRQMQSENEQQALSQSGGKNQQDSLLPESAELKLLRSSQVRINTRTQVIESTRDESGARVAGFDAAFRTLANRQVQCAEMALEIRDRRQAP